MKTLLEVLKGVTRLDDQDTPTDASDDEMLDDITLDVDNPDEEQDPESETSTGEDDDLDIDLSGDPATEPNADTDSPWDAVSSGGAVGDSGEEQTAQDGEVEEEPVDPEADKTLDAVANQASEDPDRQGVIRTVKGAHMVYKRQNEDGTYDELWIYNISTLQDELTVRRAILAGTDIPINKSSSPDGSQQYTMWSAGNAEMLLITGLQN